MSHPYFFILLFVIYGVYGIRCVKIFPELTNSTIDHKLNNRTLDTIDHKLNNRTLDTFDHKLNNRTLDNTDLNHQIIDNSNIRKNIDNKELNNRNNDNEELNNWKIENELNNRITDNKELNNRTVDSKELNNRTIDNKELNNRTIDNKELNNRTIDNKELNNRNIENELNNSITDNKELNNHTIDNKELNNRTIDNKELNNRNIENELNNSITDNKELNNHTIDNKELNNRTIDNELNNRTIDNELNNPIIENELIDWTTDVNGTQSDCPVGQTTVPNITQIRNEVLLEQNRLRSRHGSNELRLNCRLSDDAQKLAEYFAGKGTFEHSRMEGIGENLYRASNVNFSAEKAVGEWYHEGIWYNFNYPEELSYRSTVHFTQLLWKSSTDVGIGFASYQGVSLNVYLVCLYKPVGNIKGKYAENVPPLLEKYRTLESDAIRRRGFGIVINILLVLACVINYI